MAVDPEVKTPTESTNDPISSEGKEELVEDAQVDILEEDDDFEEFKEDRKFNLHFSLQIVNSEFFSVHARIIEWTFQIES